MKTIREKIYSGALLLGAVAFLASCSDADKDCGTGDGEDTVYDISRVMLEMTETETDSPEAVTRATGFVVNTDSDPTYSLTAKHGWTLALVIYDKDGDPYDEGQGTLTWDGSYWTSDTQLYMPNYLMQNVSAELYPSTWTPGVSTIETDQSTEADFLRQDILVQDGEPTYQTAPAHYLEVRMRHAHSMLDIVLANVDPTHIVSVEIIAGGNTYNPYKAGVTSREEYMVILPVGSMNPVIEVTTQAGAVYRKELTIGQTAINRCYYVRLAGLELELEAITVSNWTYGEAVPADYMAPTSYPTFRGTENTQLTVYYDNGTNQTLSFNDRGEATEKPLGRTIIRIESGMLGYDFSEPLSIRTMVIDLNPYIALMF